MQDINQSNTSGFVSPLFKNNPYTPGFPRNPNYEPVRDTSRLDIFTNSLHQVGLADHGWEYYYSIGYNAYGAANDWRVKVENITTRTKRNMTRRLKNSRFGNLSSRDEIIHQIKQYKRLGAAIRNIYSRKATIVSLWNTISTELQNAYDSGKGHRFLLAVQSGCDLARQMFRDYGYAEYAVPWHKEDWWQGSPYQYLHLPKQSEKSPGLMSYYQTAEKRARDIRTPVKVGKYLQQFFGDVLTGEAIRFWSSKWDQFVAPAEFYLTPVTTEENESEVEKEWLNVYANGPHSCMQRNRSIRVYVKAGNTLRLAYIRENGDIVARCIVRDDDMEYVRIYPTDNGRLFDKLKSALESKGYKHGNLDGVHGRLIEEDRGIVCPYVDCGNGGGQSISVHSSYTNPYIKFGGGSIEACSTSGYVMEGVECCECGDHVDEDDAYNNDNGDQFCSHCWHEHYVEAIGRRGYETWEHRDNCVYCESNDTYYVEYYTSQNDVYMCEITGNWYHADDMVLTDRGYIHEDEAASLDVPDAYGNEFAHPDDVTQTYDGRTIHAEDAVEIEWADGCTYTLHKDDSPEDYLPEVEEEDLIEFHPDGFPNAVTVSNIYE